MKDKVIVITGASSGIGAALAEVVAARRRQGRARRAPRPPSSPRSPSALGGNTLAVVTDVTRRAEVERLRDDALARFGQIDVWVNNAGRGITRPVTQLTDADFDDMMTINVKSVLYGIQAVLPHFRERRRGHLITVSSMLGRIPMAPIRSAYSAAKAAVNSLMASLRLELARRAPRHPRQHRDARRRRDDFGENALHGGPDSRALAQRRSRSARSRRRSPT